MKYSYNEVKQSFHAQEPWINVFILKHLTVPLVYLMVNFTKITPNIISFLSVSFGFLSAYYYVLGNEIVGAILYFISYIFDATDGKVARITKTGQPYGAWLDISIDRFNLTFISTAIAYNYFLKYDDVNIMLLNCIFLGLAFIGWESRYNIDYYKLKHRMKDEVPDNLSKYALWCVKNGVVKTPISLPELFLFHLILAPNFQLENYSLIALNLFLVLRIILQQKFWIRVIKGK